MHGTGGIGALGLIAVGKNRSLTDSTEPLPGHVVQAQNHILGRHDDRPPVSGGQNIVAGHHQHPCLQLRLQPEGHMHRHLIAIEVRVEGRTDQRMQLDRLALDQHRFKGLNPQAVQRGARFSNTGC